MTVARLLRLFVFQVFVPLCVLSSVPIASAQTRLEGRVIDPDGRPIAAATIVATSVTSPPVTSRTSEDGRFSIEGLVDDVYDITASAPGLFGEARGVRVATATAPLEITMRISAVTESLIVSAANIDQPLSRTADSVTVITAKDLEARQVTSLGEALGTVAGLTVVRSGGPGTLTSLFPRGGESDYTLVLVDGIRANAFGGGLDLSQVPLADAERIEVVRGPQSALYGADAIGGVVQVITRRGGAPSLGGHIEGGSRTTRRFGATTTGDLGGWHWHGGGDYFDDEGFTGTAPASGEQVSNDDTRQRQGWGGGGWRASRGTELHATFRYVDTNRGAPGPYGSDPAKRFFGVDRIARGTTERRAGGVRVVHPWTGPSGRLRQRFDFDVADYDLFFVSAFGRSESETRRVHGRLQTDAALDAGVGVSGGVEWLSERARSTFITAETRQVPVERRVIGTFGEARWHAAERVSVQAGLRAEHITRQQLSGNPSTFAPRPDFDDDTVTSLNPKVSAGWLISPTLPADGARAWTRVRAAVGTGIRPPDAFDIAFTDNPNLKPERSRSVEAGVTQVLAGGAVQLDATTFFNNYDDLIVSVGSLRDVSRYRTDNVSNARARGIEVGSAWTARRGINVRASYTFLDTEIREVDGSAQAPSPYRVGDALPRRPRHQGSLALTWSLPRTSLFATLEARGDALDVEPAFGAGGGLYQNPGYGAVSVGGSVHLARGLDVFARVLNLLDRDYEQALGFPAPGRTAFAGVRLAAGR